MRIAIIRFSSLGDIICTGPAVRALRARWPEAELIFITSPAFKVVAKALPGVDRVETVRRRGDGFRDDVNVCAKAKWDVVADLQGSPKSARLARAMKAPRRITDRPPRFRRFVLIHWKLRWGKFWSVPERMLRRIASWGAKDDGGSLALEVSEAMRAAARALLPDLERTIVLVPGAQHETKRWPELKWVELIEQLNDRKLAIVGERGECPETLARIAGRKENVEDLTGATSLEQLAGILEGCQAVITGDTGPMHLAVAFDRPTVAIFGSTVREFGFYPFRAGKTIVLEREDMKCRPCSAHGSVRCPKKHHRCMKDIEVSEVMTALQTLKVVSEPLEGRE